MAAEAAFWAFVALGGTVAFLVWAILLFAVWSAWATR